jgi:hypothetical protein
MKLKSAVLSFAIGLAVATLAFGKPGEGIRIGNLAISPFVDLSITYDDNVFLTGLDEEEDYFIDIVPGIALLNRTDTVLLRGRAWGQFRRYDEFDEELDHDSYGETVGAVLGGEENPFLLLHQKYVHLDDYEIIPRSVDTLNIESQDLLLTQDRTERVERDIFDVAVVMGRNLTDKIRVDVGYGFSEVDYDTLPEAQPFTGQDELFDWDEQKLQAELQHEITDKTSALLTGQLSEQDSDGFDDNAEYYIVRGGFITRTTRKTSFKGGVGFESYDAAAPSPEGEDLDEEIINFDVSAIWEATPKLTLQVSGRNGIQPATQYRSNTKVIHLVSLALSYRLTETLRLSLAGSWRNDDYVARVPVTVGGEIVDLQYKEREHLGGRVRLDYWPHAKFYDLYVEASYEDVEDNLEDDYEDYDQLRVAAGLSLRY